MTRKEAIKLIEHISIAFVPTNQYGDYDDPEPYEEALNMAIEALSVDVVRCKDCKHYKKINPKAKSGICCKDIVASVWNDDGFCSRGERKGGDLE